MTSALTFCLRSRLASRDLARRMLSTAVPMASDWSGVEAERSSAVGPSVLVPCIAPKESATAWREEQAALILRLRKAEGQIRGIQKMVEENAYCPDILTQVSAVTSALNSFNKELLACHIRSCVAEDIREGRNDAIDEFVKITQKLMK